MKKLAVIALVAGITSCSGGGSTLNSPRYEPSVVAQNVQAETPFSRSCQLVASTLSGNNTYDQNYTVGASANDAWSTAGDGVNGRVPDLYHFNGSSWKAVVVPPLNGSSNWNSVQLGPIAVVSANDVWIAGAGFNHTGSASAPALLQRQVRQSGVIPFSPPPEYAFPFILHWNGTALKVVDAPADMSSGVQLLNMSALSANDIWATGVRDVESLPRKSFTVVMHWNGTKWSSVTPPEAAQSQPVGLATLRTNNVAFGVNPKSGTPYVARWNGSGFVHEALPREHGSAVSFINDVEGSEDAGVFVVGYLNGTSASPYLAHGGPPWQTFYIASAPANSAFDVLSVVRKNDAFAFGFDGNSLNGYVLSYDGTTWSMSTNPFGNGQSAVGASPLHANGNMWMTAYDSVNNDEFAELLRCPVNS